MIPILDPEFHMPADGWCHCLTAGEYPNSMLEPDPAHPGTLARVRVMQVIDKPALEAMVNAFNLAAAVPNFTGLLVDRDHESDDPDKTTDAWGWCTALENRADGLYCRIRWTDIGEPAVRGGRFRFLSPVFSPADCEVVGNRRLRPMRLLKLGLTNDPNIRPLRPLTNSAQAAAPAASGDDSPDTGGKESSMDYKAQLLALLGLPAEASDEQITAAVESKTKTERDAAADRETLQNRATAAEAKASELETWKQGRLRADLEIQVETDLETHKDVVENRDEVKAQLLVNRDGTLKVLTALRKPAAGNPPPPALRNNAAKAPDGLTDDAQKLRNRRADQDRVISETQKKFGCASRAAAIERAQAEHPELFGTRQ